MLLTYIISGGVAQMVERSFSIREVRGSMPRSSKFFAGVWQIGISERFYMQERREFTSGFPVVMYEAPFDIYYSPEIISINDIIFNKTFIYNFICDVTIWNFGRHFIF